MNKESIYKSIIKTKTQTELPLLESGKSLESKYNPELEAQRIIDSLEKDYNFFLIFGFSSGTLIKKLLEQKNSVKILCLEYSIQDFQFLENLEIFRNIKNHKNLCLITKDNFMESLIQEYNPSFYGDIKIIQRPLWAECNKEEFLQIKEIFNKAMEKISQDFSVQSHFGKIWQHNIFSNLQSLKKNKKVFPININTNKIALVVAAGPSLDEKISLIKRNRDSYIIIATDTGFKILLENNIHSDFVLSLDSQLISYNHFINEAHNTTFLFDISGNSSAIKNLINKKNKVAFFSSGHPFSNLINNYQRENGKKDLLKLTSGSGTVCLAALDFAVKAGFNKIELIGADFSYPKNKAYGKGSYLDNLYEKNSSRIKTYESQFENLRFRTPLFKNPFGNSTSIVLENYRNSLINYFQSLNLNYKYENSTYFIENKNQKEENQEVLAEFNYKDFLCFIKKENSMEINLALLPFIAYLRKSRSDNLSIQEFTKLALESFNSYT